MSSFFRNLWHYEPMVLAWALNGGLAAACAFLFHTSPAQTAAITTIAAAAATAYTAVKARPVEVPVFVGALATIATASAAFGLHLSAAQIGTGVAVISGILALAFRQNVSPAAGARPA